MSEREQQIYSVLMPILASIAGISIASWLYLWIHRHWAPLAGKQLDLMGIQIIFGSIWALFHYVGDSPNRFTDSCELIYNIAIYAGSGVWIPALAIRFFQLEQVLVDHDPNLQSPMRRLFKWWLFIPLERSMVVVMYPWLGWDFEWDNYNEDAGRCPPIPDPLPPDGSGLEWLQPIYTYRGTLWTLFPYAVVYVLMIRTLIRLKNVRSQFNEFREAAWSLAFSAGGFLPTILGLGTVPMVIIYFLTVMVMYWSIVGVPLYHFIKGDKEYLHKFTYGFDEMPTAEMLTANLENQLAVPAVREQFRKFAGKRFAVENLDFYEACLARDQLTEWFERQAQTMKVIDTFIVPGAPKEVNIPDLMRQDIFSGNVNDIDLFEAAKREIMRLMTTNMGDEFANTKEMIGMKESAAEMNTLMNIGLGRSDSSKAPKSDPSHSSTSGSDSGGFTRSNTSRVHFSTSGTFSRFGKKKTSVDLAETGHVVAPGQVLDEEVSELNKRDLKK